MKYEDEPLNHILQNGETLEYYWTLANHENMGYDDYFALYKQFLESSKDQEQARELFLKINAYFSKDLNALVDEIVYLTQEEKE